MSFGCPCWIPTIFSEGKKGWRGRGAGGEGLDDVRAQGPPLAIKSRGSSTRFHTKIIFIALPACHPVPPLCARRGGREPLLLILEPAAVTLDRVIASQRGIYCDGWREREREIKSSDSNLSVSAFEHISLCKFCPLRRLPCLLSNKIPKILWILLEYSYPPFIYPSVQDNNSETEEKKEGEIKTSRATIATGAIIRLLLTQGGGEWGADR